MKTIQKEEQQFSIKEKEELTISWPGLILLSFKNIKKFLKNFSIEFYIFSGVLFILSLLVAAIIFIPPTIGNDEIYNEIMTIKEGIEQESKNYKDLSWINDRNILYNSHYISNSYKYVKLTDGTSAEYDRLSNVYHHHDKIDFINFVDDNKNPVYIIQEEGNKYSIIINKVSKNECMGLIHNMKNLQSIFVDEQIVDWKNENDFKKVCYLRKNNIKYTFSLK